MQKENYQKILSEKNKLDDLVKNNGEQIEQLKQTLQNITEEQAKNEADRQEIILKLKGLNTIIDSRGEKIAEIQEENSRLQNDYNEKTDTNAK